MIRPSFGPSASRVFLPRSHIDARSEDADGRACPSEVTNAAPEMKPTRFSREMRAAIWYRYRRSTGFFPPVGRPEARIGIAPMRADLVRRTVGVPLLDQKPRTGAGEADPVHSTQRRSADYIGIDEPGRRTDKRTDRVQQLRLETCNSRLQRAPLAPKLILSLSSDRRATTLDLRSLQGGLRKRCVSDSVGFLFASYRA
jgi:hypothetical protein